jgi:hypothetical protein
MARVLALMLVVLTIPCLLGAQDRPAPCPNRSHVDLTYPALMTTCPAGDGPAYEYVQVFAMTKDGDPIEGLPSSEFSFAVDGDVTVSPVDEATNENGFIRFTMTGNESIVRLGADWLHVECTIADVPLNDADSLHVNSFDLDGDGCVDEKDVSIFQSLYLQNDLRADYYRDGIVNMKDLSFLVDHDGHCVPEEEEELEPTGQTSSGEATEAEPPAVPEPPGDDGD